MNTVNLQYKPPKNIFFTIEFIIIYHVYHQFYLCVTVLRLVCFFCFFCIVKYFVLY